MTPAESTAPAQRFEQTGGADFITGGGEMGDLIRAFDWAGTPIGPPEYWSPAMRTMVRILLANRFPMLLWWGPEYVSIYNDAYRPILGLKHPWGLGRPVRECWAEIWDILKPLIDTPFEGGPATWSEDIELQINRSGFMEETHFTIAYSPVPDDTAKGGIGGVLATVHEITEKVIGERRSSILRDLGSRFPEAKTAEEACAGAASVLAAHPKDLPFALLYLLDSKLQEAQLAASVGIEDSAELAPPSIAMKDSAGSLWPLVTAWRTNKTQIVDNLPPICAAVSQSAWPDPPQQAVVVPIRAHDVHQLAGFLIAGLSPRLRYDDNYRTFIDLVTSQIATGIGSARAYEVERSRAEALAEIDRAKTAFFDNVSHEFRTPLTLMLGPLERVLSAGSALGQEEREQLTTAHRNSLRLLKLVNSLLDFSRIEAGRTKASYAPVDLAAITRELAANFCSTMEAAGLDFVVDCPPLPAPVYIDREMWEKIVLNLLSNAFKFTLEGRVSVSITADPQHALLNVRDTGVGIPESELPHIFERFHRVEGARGRTYEGTGIGLALIQELVKLHGGTVTVTSRLREGTTFTVTVPLGTQHLPVDRIAAGSADTVSTGIHREAFTSEAGNWIAKDLLSKDRFIHPADEVPASLADPEKRRGRIILADDNTDMREHILRILDGGYEVVAVVDGAAALAAAREKKPDLILSDAMMPVLDGFGLLQKIRQDPELRDVPVILVSARAGNDARIEGITAGADDYLTKPFNASELLARVETTLRLHRIRQATQDQLRRANSDLEQFAYTASHDLQEPLRGVKIYSELLAERYGQNLEGQAREFLNYIQTGATRMEALVRDLLAFTQTTLMEASSEVTDANASLNEALANLAEAIAESSATVQTDLLPSVRIHSTHLERVFQNLVGNSIKYRRPGVPPVIRVSAERKDQDWLFRVADNGIGIEEEYKERIFGLFKRLHGSEYAGTGLGLAICQRIVERYHGRIWVESELERGSSFFFTLPR